MLKLLVKKQLMEVFRGYFVNSKTNQKRSTKSTILYILLFVGIMFGVLGVSFGGIAYSICGSLVEVKMDWLYFLLMSIISILIGTFAAAFASYGQLYFGKDNDLLLSLPIPIKLIVISRVISVYVMGLLYSSVAFIPSIIVYQITVGFNGTLLIFEILQLILVSLIVTILSCVVGLGVAKVSQKITNKSYIKVVVSLIFFAAYYYFYYRFNNFLDYLIVNSIVYGEELKDAAYVIYAFGNVSSGNLMSILVSVGIIIGVLIVVLLALSKSFLGVVTTKVGEKKKTYKAVNKTKPVLQALYSKEFSKFTSSSSYMLNKGLGIVMMPVLGVITIFKGSTILDGLNEMFGGNQGILIVVVITALCMAASMNDIASPAISLEGKNLWILKSLPVSTDDIVKAILTLQLRFTLVPLVIAEGCIIYTLKPQGMDQYLITFLPILFVYLVSLFALYLGLNMAILNWTNEIVVIKNTAFSAIAQFSGLIYAVVFAGVYIFFEGSIDYLYYCLGFAGLTLILIVILKLWFKIKADKVFRSL